MVLFNDKIKYWLTTCQKPLNNMVPILSLDVVMLWCSSASVHITHTVGVTFNQAEDDHPCQAKHTSLIFLSAQTELSQNIFFQLHNAHFLTLAHINAVGSLKQLWETFAAWRTGQLEHSFMSWSTSQRQLDLAQAANWCNCKSSLPHITATTWWTNTMSSGESTHVLDQHALPSDNAVSYFFKPESRRGLG